MQLRSSGFSEGSTIPQKFTCEGEDVSPPLDWAGAPPETRSFVILCEDPDAPAGTWHHWAVYDIPAGWTGLPEGIRRADRTLKQGANDSGNVGYDGPCPPHGRGPHRYRFTVLAVSVSHLPLSGRPSWATVEREARKHVLSEATLNGIYERR